MFMFLCRLYVIYLLIFVVFFFFKQKTAYEMRISDWSSDVCSSDLPFFDEQVPQAVIALKQGVGRLIRSETDRGVLMLCDPRLLAKGYGRIFLNSLPPLPRTRVLSDVEKFFAIQSQDRKSVV